MASAIVPTQKEAAAALGVTVRQLRNWLSEPWFPANGRGEGGYDVDAIRTARDAEGRKGSEQSETRNKIRDARAAEQLKRERLRTRREELELQRDEGTLIPRDGVEVFASAFLTEFGDWCDQLPTFIARLVPAKAKKRVRAALQAELDQRRAAMRDTLAAKAREFDHAHGGEPSA